MNKTNLFSSHAAFAVLLVLVAFSAFGAKTSEEVARERRYPARYCSGAETREEIAALIEEL